MILKIWLKLFLIAILVTAPIVVAQYWMQKESVSLIFDVAHRGDIDALLASHMANLKKLSGLDPKNSESYREEFEKTNDARTVGRDTDLMRNHIVDDILTQTLRNTFFVLLVALAATYGVARSIVSLLRRLIKENQTQSLRLERLSTLESWQEIARMMVHEMRGPMTPIKLVATDMESKYQSLDDAGFSRYLAHGTELIRNQVSAVERLTDNLTRFSKLPEVEKKEGRVSRFLSEFALNYQSFAPDLVTIHYEKPSGEEPSIGFDAALLNQLFFNLLKNAAEANTERPITVRLEHRFDSEKTSIAFANTGNLIPEESSEKLFKLYVSTKDTSHGSNFGVGLTIAKKIALDHQGDLNLIKNNSNDGVVFELELPNGVRPT